MTFKSKEILKALEGHYTPTGLFALKQAHAGFRFYQSQIIECDKAMQDTLEEINKDNNTAYDTKGRKKIKHNPPKIEGLAGHLLKILDGKDGTVLPGITDYIVLRLLTELGPDLSKWTTEKHFVSWLGLAPGQNHSGKKKKNAKKHSPKAGNIFRLAAQSILYSNKLALGEFGRRIRARKGPGVAVKATARKLAVQYWRLMVKGQDYVEKGIDNYHEQLLERKKRSAQRLKKEIFQMEKNLSLNDTYVL